MNPFSTAGQIADMQKQIADLAYQRDALVYICRRLIDENGGSLNKNLEAEANQILRQIERAMINKLPRNARLINGQWLYNPTVWGTRTE